ncbi:LacI family DNA-binding transcriptional regulator [Frigoribacterium salinisoli]
MTKAPTVYDVAAHAGVSIATVSRVLRRPDDVRPETRSRVRASVLELGYVPSGAARGLAGRRTGVLGLFLPGHDAIEEPEPDWAALTDARRIELVDETGRARPSGGDGPTRTSVSPYFDEVLRGAEVEAWRRGFALMVAAGRGPSREVLVNDIAGRVDGLAVLASTVPDELLAHVARRIPVVVLADAQPGDQLDHVSVDNRAGMRALAEHVLADLPEGRHVVFVSGPADSPDDADRHAGFDDAVRAVGLQEARVELVHGDFGRERGREVGAALVAGRGADVGRASCLPALVVCANDQTALGVLEAFRAAGVDVPGQVRVTGFDGIDATRFSVPALTTVRQPMDDLGRVAVRTILARLADPALPPQRVTLPVRVLLRESTGG